MTLRAVVKDGGIRLIDPLPDDVKEGQEVSVDLVNGDEDEDEAPSPDEVAAWLAEADRLAAEIDPKDIDLLQRFIAEDRAAARAMMRREWGLP